MEAVIEIQNLTKRFGKFRALDNVSLSFHKGNAIALLGPNGSGKTTMIKSVLGLVIPESGSIKINGIPVTENERYRGQIGYMPQIGRYPENMTIGQVFGMLKSIRTEISSYDEELVESYSINNMLNKTMRSLSGGTRQKVSACLAFLFRPEILILDEPTAGLDPVSSEILKEKIIRERNKGKLILITSHVLSDLDEITSHVVYLQDGKILYSDTYYELERLTQEDRLNKMMAKLISSKLNK